MPDRIKLRMKSGAREIEIEGSRAEVDALLQVWWKPVDEADAADPESGERKRESLRRPTRKSLASAAGGGVAKTTFDAQPIVNAMRDHSQYDSWETKVLHARSAINKIKLVSWFDKQYRTSGEIKTILEGLSVKMGLPQVSEALSKNMADFLQDNARTKGAIVRYKLTGKAERAFEEWLNGNA